MREIESDASMEGAEDLLQYETNAIAVVMRIDGVMYSDTMKVPDVEDITTDDSIGTVGYAIGHHLGILGDSAAKTLNEIVKEKKSWKK